MNARSQRYSLPIFIYISFLLTLMSVHIQMHALGFFRIVLAALFIGFVLLFILTRHRAISFRTRLVLLGMAELALFSFLWIRLTRYSIFDCGVPFDCICKIKCRVIQDSSFTQSGNHIMTVRVTGVTAINGIQTNARGLVNAIGKTKAIITSGTELTLYGSYSDGIFSYTDLLVTKKTIINSIRERLILFIENRISSDSDPASLLSILLLLGRSEDSKLDIKQGAQNCGCTHVLALSGMHLNVITSILKFSKILCCFFILVFVFIAGPRPSLIRAALMYFLSFLPIEKRLSLTLLIQSVFFPYTFANTGCSYSFISIAALVFLSPLIGYSLSLILGKKLGNGLGRQLAVVLINTPLTLYLNKQWYPSVFIAGPVSGILVSMSMILGLLILIFGRLTFLVKINGFVYRLLDSLFDFCSRAKPLHFTGYIVMLVLTVFSCLISKIYKKIIKH